MAEYLLVLIVILAVSLILEFKYHTKLYSSRKERIIIPLIFFVIGIVWDSFAVYRGHWTFEGTGLIGINLGLLPIEEYLFFLIIPFFSLTLYKFLKKEIK